ncbi:hypothetical protein [Novosphingobium sp.]|uniref:hypothetical protein n=1 Tax=Novosphingobium sp. TaxID=1874826 RepID=UPI003568A0D3
MIAVLTHSLSMARIWLEVDFEAVFTNYRSGILPGGRQFFICTSERDLRARRDITEYWEGPPVYVGFADFRKLYEMRVLAECILEYRK